MKKIISIAAAVLLLVLAVSMAAIYYYAVTQNQSGPVVNNSKAESVYIPNSVNYLKSDVYTTPYGTFEPIEHILEINEYMTLHPNMLDAKMSACYITPDGDEKRAEEVLLEIKQLSDSICKGVEDKTKKAQKLAMWVGQNVAYDFDASNEMSDLSVTSLDAILKNDYKTTCGGFSNLYSALCYVQDIYCLNMKGGSSSEGYTRDMLEKAPANHEWNAVYIDGAWIFVDCTWISDLSYENGAFSGGTNIMPFYSAFGFGEMSIEHRIDRCEYRIFELQ